MTLPFDDTNNPQTHHEEPSRWTPERIPKALVAVAFLHGAMTRLAP
jgi:hypothetical protein